MKIAIISDSHDNIENLDKAIELINKSGAEELIHCGDLSSSFMLEVLAKFKGEIHLIYGNLDDKYHILQEALAYNINIHGDSGDIIKDNKKIAFIHSKKDAEDMLNTDRYDIVFYGHSHIKNKEKIKNTWLVNPGEIQGRKGERSFAVYNTEDNSVEFIEFN